MAGQSRTNSQMEKSSLNGRDFHCTHFGFYSVAENVREGFAEALRAIERRKERMQTFSSEIKL